MISESSNLLALLYALPLGLTLLVYTRVRRRQETRSMTSLDSATRDGLTEPASLHPAIDPSRCLGCGACAKACPEEDVLGLIRGKALLVNPTHCIGHGACRTACPFDAITLVLGTEKRGVEIPLLDPDFQTAVPGIFVAGELGGMGLIRNAVEQGRQVIESVRRLDGLGRSDRLDVLIVGAGPAGLAASLAALESRLRFVTIEQETLGGTVAHYPRGKIVMSQAGALPVYGRIPSGEVSKETLLGVFADVVNTTRIPVRYQERVEAIAPDAGGFQVKTSRASYATRAVVLAIGRRGTPAKLGVPGEDARHVVYSLVDPAQYRGRSVLVVGGGDSAIEAALSIGEEPQTSVALSYRSAAFSRAKPANRARLESASAAGRVRVLLESNVLEIGERSARLRTSAGELELAADAVIVCVGGVLPTAFLHAIGVETETKHGTPLH